MTWAVRVRPEAELDLLIAASWYETQRTQLGTEFLEEMSALVASLAEKTPCSTRKFSMVCGACSRADFPMP